MQNADTITAIYEERGRKGKCLEGVYRQLFNPELFLDAYGRLYSNAGAMTRGATQETVDGMSTGKIDRIVGLLRNERYEWTCPFSKPHLFRLRASPDDGTTDVPLAEERPWQGSGGRRRSGRR